MKQYFYFVFICIISFSSLHPQTKVQKAKIDSLNQIITILTDAKNNIGIINQLLEILKINPDETQAQSQLSSMIKVYYNQIPEELLNQSIYAIKVRSKLPIIQLLVHYYKNNDLKRIQESIYFIAGNSNINFKINPEFLFSVDNNSNPKAFNDILVSIKTHILPENISNYIFLNYLVDPNQSLSGLIQRLNLNLEDINLCIDSLEILRIKSKYFAVHPHPSEELFELIRKNLDDCIRLQDPLWRILYFYQRNQELKINNILNDESYFKSSYRIDLKLLSTLDFTSNIKLAKKIIKHISKFVVEQSDFTPLSEVELLNLKALFHFCEVKNQIVDMISGTNVQLSIINFYNNKLYSFIDYIFNLPYSDSTYFSSLSIDELKKFKVSTDEPYAKKIISRINDYLFLKSLRNYDDDILYELNKLCYSMSIYSYKINKELIDRINPNDVDFEKMAIWGISCALENDEDRAQRLFNNIQNFGDTVSIDYLKREIEWWKNIGVNSEIFSVLDQQPILKISNSELLLTNQTIPIKTISDIHTVTGKNYYALLIGIDDYLQKDMNLKFPIRDVNNLKDVLISEYLFEDDNIITLANPKRTQIFEAFNTLRKKLTQYDNLLIFYAGHGYWDKDLEQGYWIPSDSQSKDRTNWLSNSEIIDLLKGIKSLHTLLIADACFAGSIFVTRKAFHEIDKSLEFSYSQKSRNGITSGANTPVPDKSVFVEMFIKKLKQNKEKYLPAVQLYLEFRDNVTNNSQIGQRPLFGELEGNEGGEFIFIRK